VFRADPTDVGVRTSRRVRLERRQVSRRDIMAKLDVVAAAGPGFATAESQEPAQADVAVCRSADGSPVTGLTDSDFEVWVSFSGNITGGVRAWILVVEKVASGLGPDGYYAIAFRNGDGDSTWGPPGVWFVEIVVKAGSDTGQTLAAFDLPS
jgi:hypothetical protein